MNLKHIYLLGNNFQFSHFDFEFANKVLSVLPNLQSIDNQQVSQMTNSSLESEFLKRNSQSNKMMSFKNSFSIFIPQITNDFDKNFSFNIQKFKICKSINQQIIFKILAIYQIMIKLKII